MRGFVRHYRSWLWCVCAVIGSLPFASLAQTTAFQGEPPAIVRMLQEGDRAERGGRFAVAVGRYCAAARFGSTEAQYRLGRLYHTGRGVRRDAAVAATLLSVAARKGHVQAARLLGQTTQAYALPDCMSRANASLRAGIPADLAPGIDAGDPGRVSGERRRYAQLIERLAPEFGVDPRLALAVARTESNFDPLARSPKNAQGLMQLIPDTAERFGVRDSFDPEQNVRGGLAYLRWLIKRFDGEVILVAAAYNAGEGAVDRHGGVPPYAETREYVRRILSYYPQARHAFPAEATQVSLLTTAY